MNKVTIKIYFHTASRSSLPDHTSGSPKSVLPEEGHQPDWWPDGPAAYTRDVSLLATKRQILGTKCHESHSLRTKR
jgi:hypothetical protein